MPSTTPILEGILPTQSARLHRFQNADRVNPFVQKCGNHLQS